MIVSVDANVLVYAIDAQAGRRHERAARVVERLVASDRGVLVLQALAEFYSVATRKLGTSAEDARGFVHDLRSAAPVRAADERALDRAMAEGARHRLSFWDALLWATADGAGVRFLLTEDFQDGRTLGGVTFVNPFEAKNQPFLDRELPPVAL